MRVVIVLQISLAESARDCEAALLHATAATLVRSELTLTLVRSEFVRNELTLFL